MKFTHTIEKENLRYSEYATERNVVEVTCSFEGNKPVVTHINIPMGVINNISSFTGLQHACEMEAERLYKGVKGHMLAQLYCDYVSETTAAAGVVMPIAKWAAWRLNNKEAGVLKQVYPQTRHY